MTYSDIESVMGMVSGRKANVKRKTSEVEIEVELNIDGTGKAEITTGIPFFDHMLRTLARHSGMDIKIRASGDLEHHIIEDVGIALGKALKTAVGDKKGIARFGWVYIPMDDALARCVLDFSGRPYTVLNTALEGKTAEKVAGTVLIHFFEALAFNAGITLHLETIYGRDPHHIAEACFKALAKGLGMSLKIMGNEIPSTKGVL